MRHLPSATAALALALAACGSSGGGSQTPATCPAPGGAGTAHAGDVTSSATWTAAASPHTVASSFRIAAGATLTLEHCATVRLANGVVVTVNGTLLAAGQQGLPVTIDSSGAGARWAYLTTGTGALIDLSFTTLQNGGLTGINGWGVIDLRGDAASPRQAMLRVNNVTIDGSATSAGSYGHGVVLRDGAAFTADSSALTIRNAAAQPLYVQDRLAGSIPPGTYTGNAVDEIILVAAPAYMFEDTTLHDRGIPYRLGEPNGNGKELIVGLPTGSALATLTVEAGVTVKVHPAGRVLLNSALQGGGGYQSTGNLVVAGTASRPVTFTSAAAIPAAGDWVGLWFDAAPAATARIDHAVVEYAGGPSYASGHQCNPASTTGGYSPNDDAAILVFGEPASGFVTNSTIRNSAGDGVARAYTGNLVDFLASNTFSGLPAGRCRQGYPRQPPSATCPLSVPCP